MMQRGALKPLEIALAIMMAATSGAALLGHIYLGTIGMEGAYASMRTGYVDDTWAKEHHDAWYAEIESGKISRFRSEPAAAHGSSSVSQNA